MKVDKITTNLYVLLGLKKLTHQL